MIYGGCEPAGRAPATLDALQALVTAGRLDAGIADDLAESYRVYRTIEHRLQMVDDQQTHAIPRGAAAMDRVAQLHGLVNGEALLDLLRRSEEHTSELQSLMRISYAVFCLKKKTKKNKTTTTKSK